MCKTDFNSHKVVESTAPPATKVVTEQISYAQPPLINVETSILDHMSGLLLSGSLLNTAVEFSFIACMFLLPESFDVEGSMTTTDLGKFMLLTSLVTRFYNSYLEAVYFAFPKYRTQPPKDHKLVKERRDLTGRDLEQQKTLEFHDLMTVISGNSLSFTLYFLVPGFYPSPNSAMSHSPLERVIRMLLNHYIMSFGMYWAHRALHVVPFLWNHIHSIHHYAKTPLSRVTYQDHWADNFGNAVIGQTCAQILLPLDYSTFIFSRVWRILESLEKHSGHSSWFNFAHAVQYAWLPFAQMPHHHDWHHEGHKSCNYTFSSLGGLWDCAFGTRKAGRAKTGDAVKKWATKEDRTREKNGNNTLMDKPHTVILPILFVLGATTAKLQSCGFSVC